MQEGLECKKMAPLRILQILEEYSDYDHPLKQEDIARYLDRKYGIMIERKAIGRNIRLLNDAGFEILTHKGRGVYLSSRRFEEGELRLLIDSVTFSRNIPSKYAEDLIEKLRSFGGKKFRSSVCLVRNSDMLYRTRSKDIFYLIELLNDAMTNERQVSFMYNAYGTDKMLYPVWEEVQRINPYRLIAANNHYYLVGNVDGYDNLTNFRLDKITQFEMIERSRKHIRNTTSGEFRIGAYLSAHPYMLTGEPVHMMARLAKERVEIAIDAFGDNFSLTEENETVMISVLVNEEDAYLWALQNGDAVEILEPQSLRDRVRSTVSGMRRKYLQTDADAYGEAVAAAKRNGNLDLVDLPVRSRIGRDEFARLWRLSLVKTDVKEMSFLARYSGLKVVRVINSPASDFSAIAELPQLGKLEICTTNLTSIDFLRGMDLKELTLLNDPVADFAPLYEMKGLSFFVTGTETVKLLDLERLRATYPDIRIGISDEPEAASPEWYFKAAPLGYPVNVLRVVFGMDRPFTADEKGLEQYLNERIPDLLTKEEEQFFYRRFRDGEGYVRIAIEQAVAAATVRMREARILRKMRHPSFSRQLRRFFLLVEEEEEQT